MEISDRISKRMKTIGVKAVEIARATSISSGGVSQWISGATQPTAQNLLTLSKVLKCSPDWLAFGVGNEDLEPGNNIRSTKDFVELPLLHWHEVPEWPNNRDSRLGSASAPFLGHYSDSAFALQIKNDSMSFDGPKAIPVGACVAIDPNIKEKDKSFVLALKTGTKEPILRQLIKEGDTAYLYALNPKYPNQYQELTDAWRILGVLRQMSQDFYDPDDVPDNLTNIAGYKIE